MKQTSQNKESQKKSYAQKHKIHISIKLAITLLIIGLLILVIILLIDTNTIQNPLNALGKETRKIEIKDACAIIAGKLINTIGEEDICKNACVAECESLQGLVKGIEFSQVQNACNKCSCYCRY